MNHTFDVKLAIDFCPNTAIFMNNMAYWTNHNQAFKKNFHDGRYWTYNSVKAFSIIFPYWSIRQIRTIIKSCLKNNLIIAGNYNQAGYDKTMWYAMTDKALEYFPSLNESLKTHAQPHLSELTNAFVRIDKPIPDINTDIKQDLNTAQSAETSKALTPIQEPKTLTLNSIQDNNPHNLPLEMIQEWFTYRRAKKLPVTPLVWKRWNNQLAKCADPIDAFEMAVTSGWQGINADWVNKSKPKESFYTSDSTAWAKDIEKDLW